MLRWRHSFRAVEFVRRLGGAAGVGLVLFLSVLASSPELHHWIHGDDAGGSEDGCAVVQFSGGVSVATDTAIVQQGPALRPVALRPASADVVLAAPAHRLPPGQAPPLN